MRLSRQELLTTLQQGNYQINADFSGVDLSKVDFAKEQIFLDGIRNLSSTDFSEAVLVEMNFTLKILDDANFSKAVVRRADFTEAKARRTVFLDCALNESNFFLADLSNADFQNANLSSVYFGSARLIGATFDGAIFSDETILPDGTTWNKDVELQRFLQP